MNVEQFLKTAGIVIAIGGIFYAIHLIWIYFLRPIHYTIVAICEFMEAQPTLLDIAYEFKPNNGETLRDQIDTANLRLNNIEGQMEKLIQQFTTWDEHTERRIN